MMMNIIDISLCAANAMDSFSKNLEDKKNFIFIFDFSFAYIFQSCFIVALLLLYPFMHFIVNL